MIHTLQTGESRRLGPIFTLCVCIALPAAAEDIHVKAGGDLRAAFARAQPGDTIVLEAGGRYVGPFALPVKAAGAVIIVRSGGIVPDRRITEADRPLLATLTSAVGEPVLTTGKGVSGWRFEGLDFDPFAGIPNGEAVVIDGSHDIAFDRCRIQAPATGLKRGIRANGTRITITRSRIAGVWAPGQDSQAIAAWDGAGPYTITDNYLEAASENILFGGADSSSEANMPSDIRIEGNTITKDPAWKGQPRQVKNLLELKAARRVVIRGNDISRNWTDAQQGRSILLTVRNQDGSAPWSRIEDVLIERNTITDVERGFQITGYDDNHRSGQTSGIVIRDNTITTRETAFLLGNQIKDAAIYRNKIVMPTASAGQNVVLSLDRGIRWVDGGKQEAAVAVESLTWAGNDAPGTYIHSSTANGVAALQAHTGSHSLRVPTGDPRSPDPDHRLQDPATLAPRAAARPGQPVRIELEAARLAARGQDLDAVPGRGSRTEHVLQLLLHVTAAQAQLARER